MQNTYPPCSKSNLCHGAPPRARAIAHRASPTECAGAGSPPPERLPRACLCGSRCTRANLHSRAPTRSKSQRIRSMPLLRLLHPPEGLPLRRRCSRVRQGLPPPPTACPPTPSCRNRGARENSKLMNQEEGARWHLLPWEEKKAGGRMRSATPTHISFVTRKKRISTTSLSAAPCGRKHWRRKKKLRPKRMRECQRLRMNRISKRRTRIFRQRWLVRLRSARRKAWQSRKPQLRPRRLLPQRQKRPQIMK